MIGAVPRVTEIRPAGEAAEPPAGREPASPCASSPARAGWRRIRRTARRIEESVLGDVAAAIIMGGLVYAGLVVFMGVLG